MSGVRSGGSHRATMAVAVVLLAVVVAACGGRDDEDRFSAAYRKALESSTTVTTGPGSVPSGEPSATAPGQEVPTTAPPASADPPASLLAAVDAFRNSVGGGVNTVQMTVHFPTTGVAYASLRYRDPANPANVDERDWRDGNVGQPEPVRLTGVPGEAESFVLDAIDWNAVAAALPGARALVEQQAGVAFENSDGVTHIIAKSDQPFSPATVVSVYVDGGDRSTGGYVQLRTDGSVEKVLA